MNECNIMRHRKLVVDGTRPELRNGATWIISYVGSPLISQLFCCDYDLVTILIMYIFVFAYLFIYFILFVYLLYWIWRTHLPSLASNKVVMFYVEMRKLNTDKKRNYEECLSAKIHNFNFLHKNPLLAVWQLKRRSTKSRPVQARFVQQLFLFERLLNKSVYSGASLYKQMIFVCFLLSLCPPCSILT